MSTDYNWEFHWHFVNRPYFDEGGSASDYPDWHKPEDDVIGALGAITKLLSWDTSADDTVYIQTIKKHFSKEIDQKSFALRLLIHYHGDIHQPFHDVAEVDSTNPTGDEGGNAEHITPINGVENLHAVWDSVIY